MPVIAPYGSWKSPITTELILSGAIGLGQVVLDDEDIYWSEMRPSEGGRVVIVKQSPETETDPQPEPVDVTPEAFSVRTLVHEYGGGAYLVNEGDLYTVYAVVGRDPVP